MVELPGTTTPVLRKQGAKGGEAGAADGAADDDVVSSTQWEEGQDGDILIAEDDMLAEDEQNAMDELEQAFGKEAVARVEAALAADALCKYGAIGATDAGESSPYEESSPYALARSWLDAQETEITGKPSTQNNPPVGSGESGATRVPAGISGGEPSKFLKEKLSLLDTKSENGYRNGNSKPGFPDLTGSLGVEVLARQLDEKHAAREKQIKKMQDEQRRWQLVQEEQMAMLQKGMMNILDRLPAPSAPSGTNALAKTPSSPASKPKINAASLSTAARANRAASIFSSG